MYMLARVSRYVRAENVIVAYYSMHAVVFCSGLF